MARAERFGLPVSHSKEEDKAKKDARAQRFQMGGGATAAATSEDAAKKADRAKRFGDQLKDEGHRDVKRQVTTTK